MDATDDREVKLQGASGDLVVEFSTKLPSLLWKSAKGQDIRVARRWAPAAKTEKLIALVSRCMPLNYYYLLLIMCYSSNHFKSGLNY